MEQPNTEPPLVIYVDIDDTLVRSFGSKRIPMPSVVEHVRELSEQGTQLFCWSSGGADYARQSAAELGIAECFTAFLPKPDVLLDDQQVSEWRHLVQVHPGACSGQTVKDYRQKRNKPDAPGYHYVRRVALGEATFSTS